ncbi:Predicted membrane protein [Bacillus freudenreichii]|nr:Predicted membrane protein [Bacillus freudenreichii]
MKNESTISTKISLKRNRLSGFLFGVGFIAFIDETVFHQILHWHHFYDKSTTEIGLISDGLFHAFSWFATIGGLFMFADLRRRKELSLKKWWGGIFLGAGVFQLYDGLIQHKIMRIHQIRYVDNVILYDIVWNLIAVLMIIAGFALARNTQLRRE